MQKNFLDCLMDHEVHAYKTTPYQTMTKGLTKIMVCGSSMKPFFRAGHMVAVGQVMPGNIRKGSVILYAVDDGLPQVMHRVKSVVCKNGIHWFLCQGDNRSRPDGFIGEHQVVGKVVGRFYKKGYKPVRRSHEYAALMLSGWYRRVKAAAKKIVMTAWPLLSRSVVRKVIVQDHSGREREMIFIGRGKLRFYHDFSRFVSKAQLSGVNHGNSLYRQS